MAGVWALAVQAPNSVANAQVSSDGDMYPVAIDRVAPGGKWSTSAKGQGVVWTLRASSGGGSSALATLIVTGKSAGGLAPHTEYQVFGPSFARELKAAWSDETPVYFHRTTPPPGRLWLDADAGSFRETSRLFRIAPKSTRLTADPTRGVYLFHLRSEARVAGRDAIDHYLVVRFSAAEPPRLEWYIDATANAPKDNRLAPELIDLRWAVEPGGFDRGRLTPIVEAVGHEMLPLWQR